MITSRFRRYVPLTPILRDDGAYADRLRHNFHELDRRERWRYALLDRSSLTREERFFFEGCRAIPGQMYIADRRALFETILHRGPRHCFEIGTWTGGGSTYFLASAFARLRRGKVITLEKSRGLHEAAIVAYRKHLPQLVPYVEFVQGDTPDALLPYLEREDTLDCCFLDGAEDADETMDQFTFFESFFRPGSILMAHDWETDKMRRLRPALERRAEWHPDLVLTRPDSVGFVVQTLRAT